MHQFLVKTVQKLLSKCKKKIAYFFSIFFRKLEVAVSPLYFQSHAVAIKLWLPILSCKEYTSSMHLNASILVRSRGSNKLGKMDLLATRSAQECYAVGVRKSQKRCEIIKILTINHPRLLSYTWNSPSARCWEITAHVATRFWMIEKEHRQILRNE